MDVDEIGEERTAEACSWQEIYVSYGCSLDLDTPEDGGPDPTAYLYRLSAALSSPKTSAK